MIADDILGRTEEFPSDAQIRRLTVEPAVGFGAGRALLMQLAHPAVAQGVHDHSDFRGDPFSRLLGTVEAMYVAAHGSVDLAAAVGRRVHGIHEHVVGREYRANDPEYLMWVLATLIDSALFANELVMGPLPAGSREAFFDDMRVVGDLFGCPASQPPETYAEFQDYMKMMIETLDVTDVGREQAQFVLRPRLVMRLDIPLMPALWVHRLVAVGTCPEPLRERYGFGWSARDARQMSILVRAVRPALNTLPRSIRTMPAKTIGVGLVMRARKRAEAFLD